MKSKVCNPPNTRTPFRWLVLASASLTNSLTWGSLYSCGVLYSCWSHDFSSSSKALISLVGSLPVAVGCFLGPLFGIIIQRFGYRTSSIMGGLIMSVGWVLTAYQTSIWGLLVTFGIVTGFGAGLSNFSGGTAVNDYFVKDRVLAEGIHGSALCLGLFLSTEMLQIFAEVYTWRGACLISGAIHLHICALALFLIHPDEVSTHPLNFWRSSSSPAAEAAAEEDVQEENKIEMVDMNMNYHQQEEKLIQDHNGNIQKIDIKFELDEKELDSGSCYHHPQDQAAGKKSEDRSAAEFLRISLKLWKRSAFQLLLISDVLSWIASFVPYVHLIERAKLSNIDAGTSAWINSSFGIGGLVGRFATAYFFQKLKIHPFYAYGIIQSTVGLSTMISPMWSSVEGLFIYASFYGFCGGTYGFIKASLASMLGTDVYAISFSWFLLFEGMGIALGPTVGGMLYAYTKSYTSTFIFSGALLFLSGVLSVFKNKVMQFDDLYAANDEQEDDVEKSSLPMIT